MSTLSGKVALPASRSARTPHVPVLLASQISLPRLLLASESACCPTDVAPCFLVKRGGILDEVILTLLGTCEIKEFFPPIQLCSASSVFVYMKHITL